MTHLLSALWQGAAIALAAAALLRGRRTLSAATRHAVWLVALVAVAALTTHHVVQGLAAVPDLRPPRLAMDAAAPNAAALALPAAPVWTMAALAVVWAAVTFASVMRLIRGFLALTRIRRHARPLPTELAAALRFWNRRPAATRTAALMVCDRVGGACAVGLSRRPMIVLSPALVRSLDAAALDQIVMHEHAHLVRRDDWTQALEQCVLAVFGLHPAVRYLARRLDADREMACDDRVVALTGSAAAYATCLARAAETAAAPAWSTALVTNAAGRGTLVARVQRLLDGTVNRAPRIQRLALAT
ncbi:MAG: M56 family metallopeptidase, partial [Vicinamibacterales bacterium]